MKMGILKIKVMKALLLAPIVASQWPPFPPSTTPFSSSFHEPPPPLLHPDFNASFIQHKWNQNLSHVTSGRIINCPSQRLVRAYEAYDDVVAASTFNYANVSDDGLVDNTMTMFDGQVSVWRGYVNPGFPLFDEGILRRNQAVFGGYSRRRFCEQAAEWNFMYQGAIPVSVYVDSCNVVVGYDFFAPGERTKTLTELFNIDVANVP